MLVADALRLVKGITYRPDWSFTAQDYTKRFQDSIRLRIDYTAPDTDVKWAPTYDHIINTHADFVIHLTGLRTPEEFYRQVFRVILEVELHEAREFFAVSGSEFHKPVHPHTHEGMFNWAVNFNPNFHNGASTAGAVETSVKHDLQFGVG